MQMQSKTSSLTGFEMVKLCLIGAGSTDFTKKIVTDLLLMPEFKNIELALMDIDSERLRVSDLIVRAVARQIGANPKITNAHRSKRSPSKIPLCSDVNPSGWL